MALSGLIYSNAALARWVQTQANPLQNLNLSSSTEHKLDTALRLLRGGGVVAVPTDTLYGLAADAFNPDAIERVFGIKERPDGLALPVLLADPGQLEMVAAQVSPQVRQIAEAYWPGPLTMIVKRASGLPPRLTAGHPTVAVRVPDHQVPRELARKLGRPITGTSANISGAADPQSLEELRRQVGDRVDLVVEDGPSPAGTASTIVDVSGNELKLVRDGAVPFEEIAALFNSQ
ncbi:Threonylcarbamoyl-AMP synthase [Geodia barretti]|uniref:Threonylcarbamoyl-AMP synthase n=1 Tax=Geodia barretti TaxID=519541 RepID=A0AA35TZU2_GEOBA|nr:Threonylcarbamoyl-AMP synthase [Geodia barretti]